VPGTTTTGGGDAMTRRGGGGGTPMLNADVHVPTDCIARRKPCRHGRQHDHEQALSGSYFFPFLSNVALRFMFAWMLTVQVLVPVHPPPLQPLNTELRAAVAVSVTVLLSA